MNLKISVFVLLSILLLLGAATQKDTDQQVLADFANYLALVRTTTTTTTRPGVVYTRPGVVYTRPGVVYTRPATTVVSTCPHNCFGRGSCISGICRCQSPYVGNDCSLVRRHMSAEHDGFIPRPVSRPRQVTRPNGGRTGPRLHELQEMSADQMHAFWGCKDNCSKNGFCLFGKCLCKKGFEGGACEKTA